MTGQRTQSGVTGAAKVAALGLVVVLGSVACARGDAVPMRGQPDAGRPLHAPANFDPSIPGADELTTLEKALPRANRLNCPYGPR